MAANLTVTDLGVRMGGLDPVIANLVAVASLGIVNFASGDRVVLRA